jgi:hypothetical protein
MSEQERNIDRFRGQLALVLTCKHAAALATGWAFFWGTIVLMLRATLGTPNEILLWGLVGLPLAVAIGAVLAQRSLPSPQAIRSLLDGHNHCGGLLMASEEVPLGRWKNDVRVSELPAVRWHGQRAWGLLALGVAFLCASFLVPQHFASAGGERPLDVSHRVKKLEQQLQVLREEKILDSTEAGAKQQKLKQVQEEAKGTDPAKTLEALDFVEKGVQDRAKEATEKALKATEELSKTESLADLLHKKKPHKEGGLTEKQRAEAMQELARLTREAMKELKNLSRGDKLEKGLDPELLKALKDGGLKPEDLEKLLTPEQLEKLQKALEEAKGDVKEMLAQLEKAGLVDGDKLKECENCGKADGEGMLAQLKECEGKCSIREALAKMNRPGRGGVDRGPGAAELTFGKESPEAQTKLREELLPQARLDQIRDARLKGVSIGAPELAKPGGQTTSGALSTAASGSGSAQTQVVLPRHRGTVERYFERPERK